MRRDVFQAIADPTRRAILDLLVQQPLTLNGVADNFAISRPAISKHVKILAECGLVEIEQNGRERICEVRLEKLDEVAEWLEPYRRRLEERYDRLDNLLQDLQNQQDSPNKENES